MGYNVIFIYFLNNTPEKFDECKIILIFAVELIMIPIGQQFIKQSKMATLRFKMVEDAIKRKALAVPTPE